MRHCEDKNKDKDLRDPKDRRKATHAVCVNLMTGAVWCYACDRELLPFDETDTGLSKDDAVGLKALLPLLVSPPPPSLSHSPLSL